MLAPDPVIAARDEEEREQTSPYSGGVWNIIAPDSNFTAATSGKACIETQATSIVKTDDVQTSNIPLAARSSHSTSSDGTDSTYTTPNKSQLSTPGRSNQDIVEQLVISAAKDLAISVSSPPLKWEGDKQFFSYCASSNKLSDKQLKKVRKLLKKDLQLANARASRMANLVQDGFTPLHACAHVGNIAVAEIIIEFCPESVDARDIQGRTPLHIASEQGHLEIVKLVKQKMTERDPSNQPPIGPCAPTDLAGRTPLGWASTSRETKACRNREDLRKELFSPGDVSVYGVQTPASTRAGGFTSIRDKNPLQLSYGFAEMPGYRIEMEDAMCHCYPLHTAMPTIKQETPKKCAVGFFGVFDGHGDGGFASRYVADSIVQCLTETEEWKNQKCGEDTKSISEALICACRDVDVDLRAMATGKSVQDGGSTGVIAIVTENDIIVGNVGDSRCIGIRKNESDGSIAAIALSTDHTPGLEGEKERIINAGLEVISETFPDPHNDGKDTTLYKIQKSERDRIAVARAFGDFDYKANSSLNAEEQAIICTPEIMVHPTKDLQYLVLACDGVWDVMSNEEVGKFVVEKVIEISNGGELDCEVLPAIGDELLKHCLEKGSSDNMSVMIIALNSKDSSGTDIKDDAQRVLNFTTVDEADEALES